MPPKPKPKNKQDNYNQTIHAEEGSTIKSVVQNFIQVSVNTVLVIIIFLSIPLFFILLSENQKSANPSPTPEPVYFTSSFGHGLLPLIYLVDERDEINSTRVPFINEEFSNYLSSLPTSGRIPWPGIDTILIKLTSPLGSEVFLDNYVEVKTVEFIPTQGAPIQCVPNTCVGCGGGSVSSSRIPVEIPSTTQSSVIAKPKDYDENLAFDLSFPHVFLIELRYPKDGFYNINLVLHYSYRGTDATKLIDFGQTLFLSYSNCD